MTEAMADRRAFARSPSGRRSTQRRRDAAAGQGPEAWVGRWCEGRGPTVHGWLAGSASGAATSRACYAATIAGIEVIVVSVDVDGAGDEAAAAALRRALRKADADLAATVEVRGEYLK